MAVSSFEQWILDFGVERLAAKLTCTSAAVRVWRRGHGSPTAGRIKIMIKLSKDTLSFDQILKESRRNIKS